MAAQEIKVPDIGDFAEVEVIEVHITPGARVAAEDPLITLESDKASMDVPSPVAGTIQEVRIKVGDKVSESSVVALLVADHEASDSAEAAKQPDRPASAPPPPAAAAAPADPVANFSRVHASPMVRRVARELGVDLNQVPATGNKGRVTRQDVQNFTRGGVAPSGKSAAAAPAGTLGIAPIPAVDFSKFGEIESMPLSRIKRLTAINLHRAWLNIPHVTHHDETDITALEAFRQGLKPRAEKRGVRVTLLAFFMQACAATLKAFPTFNASLDPNGENLILKRYVHIGIAVDTPNGLVVPVIRDVDHKGLFELSAALTEASTRARDKKLKPADMQGATFTISSLGGIGGTAFTPIINAPEVAILGLARAQQKPVPKGDSFEFRLMQPMSLSYDHRVIDGAEAARFVRHLGNLVSDIRLLLI